jgi:hypothetical protein
MNGNEGLRTFHIFPSTMPNLRGLLYVLLGGFVSPVALNVGTGVFSLGLVVWAAFLWEDPAVADLDFALSILVTILVSFHLLIHDLSLLIIPVFLVLNFLRARNLTWSRSGILALAPVLTLLVAFLFALVTGAKHFAPLALIVLAFALGLALLFIPR